MFCMWLAEEGGEVGGCTERQVGILLQMCHTSAVQTAIEYRIERGRQKKAAGEAAALCERYVASRLGAGGGYTGRRRKRQATRYASSDVTPDVEREEAGNEP